MQEGGAAGMGGVERGRAEGVGAGRGEGGGSGAGVVGSVQGVPWVTRWWWNGFTVWWLVRMGGRSVLWL